MQQMTIPQAAREMGVGPDVVRALIDTGALPHTKFGAHRRVPTAALAAYIEAHTYPATTAA